MPRKRQMIYQNWLPRLMYFIVYFASGWKYLYLKTYLKEIFSDLPEA